MRESRNKLTEKEMELALMLMSECNTTADVQSIANFKIISAPLQMA